jgi:hypothetical protein
MLATKPEETRPASRSFVERIAFMVYCQVPADHENLICQIPGTPPSIATPSTSGQILSERTTAMQNSAAIFITERCAPQTFGMMRQQRWRRWRFIGQAQRRIADASRTLLIVTVAIILTGALKLSAAAQEARSEIALQGTPLKDNLQPPTQSSSVGDGALKAIVIGFVGGFVRHDDARHPEVQFADYLRERYSSIHAEVFSNHYREQAFRRVLRLLDTDHDGTLSNSEKKQARIIIYGHSWGASETVSLARELGQNGIPVLLTIQVDTIPKPGQTGSTISPNVANAINFYQPIGLLHGRMEIRPADPARTKIIGNFRMTYDDYPVNCDNYGWLARVFNKPHYEIENDPRVWTQAAALIDSQLSNLASRIQASSPGSSPFLNFLYTRHR